MKWVSRDLVHDFTLRTLSVLVVTTLIVCLAFLGYRWLQPVERSNDVVPVVPAPKPAARAPDTTAPAPDKGEVLMNPGHVYRCEQGGKVVYSEQPCVPGQGKQR